MSTTVKLIKPNQSFNTGITPSSAASHHALYKLYSVQPTLYKFNYLNLHGLQGTTILIHYTVKNLWKFTNVNNLLHAYNLAIMAFRRESQNHEWKNFLNKYFPNFLICCWGPCYIQIMKILWCCRISEHIFDNFWQFPLSLPSLEGQQLALPN